MAPRGARRWRFPRRPPRRRRRPSRRRRPQTQALFTGLIVNDPRTSADVRGLLTSGAAFVGSPPQFADLTGDGRMDAVVQVRIPGAAGTVAVFAFSTDGTSDGRLRAVLRSQALYRATVAVAPATLLITVPQYANGRRRLLPGGARRAPLRLGRAGEAHAPHAEPRRAACAGAIRAPAATVAIVTTFARRATAARPQCFRR